jgi:hypothetical protein
LGEQGNFVDGVLGRAGQTNDYLGPKFTAAAFLMGEGADDLADAPFAFGAAAAMELRRQQAAAELVEEAPLARERLDQAQRLKEAGNAAVREVGSSPAAALAPHPPLAAAPPPRSRCRLCLPHHDAYSQVL